MIGRADPGDVNALRAIAAAAYQKYVPGIGWNPAPMTAGYPPSSVISMPPYHDASSGRRRLRACMV